jgi:L,D-transpeptidase ErfK/SrfK
MTTSRSISIAWLLFIFALLAPACEKVQRTYEASPIVETKVKAVAREDSSAALDTAQYIVVKQDVRMKRYFHFMDSLVKQYDSLVNYDLSEHLIVRANPWIIDTLASYDYDVRKLKGEFIKDQREAVMLRADDTLWVPDDSAAAILTRVFQNTVLDVNIPEFKLRIIEYGSVKYTFPVRVGRDERKFLALAGREVSLRTPIGEGEIVRVEKNPIYVNPVDGKQYFATHRDDGKLTELPQVPFLEPSINGQRPGSLIHPTTNPHTLGKAYSNGCVGTPEGAAWVIYYHAPLKTKVRFRYDLKVLDECGDTLYLKDIYHREKV